MVFCSNVCLGKTTLENVISIFDIADDKDSTAINSAKKTKGNLVSYLLEKVKIEEKLKEEEFKMKRDQMELQKAKFALEKAERLQKLEEEKQNTQLMITILTKFVDRL